MPRRNSRLDWTRKEHASCLFLCCFVNGDDRSIRSEFVGCSGDDQITSFQGSKYFNKIVFRQAHLNTHPLGFAVADADHERVLKIGGDGSFWDHQACPDSINSPLDVCVGSGSKQAVTIPNIQFDRHGSCLAINRVRDAGDRSRELPVGIGWDLEFHFLSPLDAAQIRLWHWYGKAHVVGRLQAKHGYRSSRVGCGTDQRTGMNIALSDHAVKQVFRCTPHTVNPSVRDTPTWKFGESCSVILYMVKPSALDTEISLGSLYGIPAGRASVGSPCTASPHHETLWPSSFAPPRPSITPSPIIPTFFARTVMNALHGLFERWVER